MARHHRQPIRPRAADASLISLGRAFQADRRGAITVLFALAGTVILGLAGAGIDYARLAARRSQLQNAVDAAVLSGGNMLKLSPTNSTSIANVVETVVRTNANTPADRALTVQTAVSADKTNVSATATENVRLAFGGLVGMRTVPITARATSTVIGKMRLCLLTLDPSAPGAFNLQKNAQVTADGCSLYSDSSNPSGMVGGDSAMAKAQTICSAGGYQGARANFTPSPQTGCPVIKDPLKDRAAPAVGPCASVPNAGKAHAQGTRERRLDQLSSLVTTGAWNLIDDDVTLDPGTYCGGMHVTKKASVTLRPGVYVMKDGPLVVDQKAVLSGTDVGFYFTGDRAGLLFDKQTTISLAAPTKGAMAGFLFAEDPAVNAPVDPTTAIIDFVDGLLAPLSPAPPPTPAPLGQAKPLRTYRIISDNARTMLGTIYLPAGRLVIDAGKPVADQSAYTVIVAAQVNLYEGPNLTLNANYNATSVPVPQGVGPLVGRIVLSQ